MRTFDYRSYSSFKHKWDYHFYIKHCCVHTIRVDLAQLIRVKLPLDVISLLKMDELTLGFVDDDFM